MKLYLLPGTMCTEKLWSELIVRLDDGVETECLTIPQGKSFEDLAKHMYQQLPADPINLIGFSLGGYLASYFASRFPERIQRLLVIANNPGSLSAQSIKHRETLVTFARTYGYKGISRMRAAELTDSGERGDPIVDIIMEMDRELGSAEFISQYQFTSERTDLLADVRQFSFPSWFYVSEGDPMIDHSWFEGLPQNKTNFRLAKTSGRGHMLPLEKPDELASLIGSWLATETS